jgi:hypothetical protein
MRSWHVVLLAVVLVAQAQPVRGQNVAELTVNLTVPQDGFINIAGCDEAEIEIAWSRPENEVAWDDDVQLDAFLATSSACDREASSSIEIGDEEDLLVTVSGTTGEHTFPPSNDASLYPLTVAKIEGLNCAVESQEDYYVCVWFTGFDDIYTSETEWSGGAPLRWDLQAPGTPTITSISPGEKNLKIKWTPPADDDLGNFIIYYRVAGTTDTQSKEVTDADATNYQITGLTNFTNYEVWMIAVDESENEGATSDVVTGTPEPVEDFWEVYRESGGSEDGGFCFVATAAYGSYSSMMVQPLRAFRDGILARSAAGRAVVNGYYRYGPRWARAIRGSETHRTVARLSLAPAVAFASVSNQLGLAETLVILAALVILLMLGFRFFKRTWVRRGVPPLLVLVLLLGAGPARAEDKINVPQHPDANFQLQIRFGPYSPDVDEESGLTGQPFKTVFGSGSELLFELGVDYEIWHGFGTVTAGGSFGFVQFLGKALTSTGAKSTDTTVLNLLPLRLNVGYHFDLLSSEFDIPLVPYVTGGISYYIWWVLDGVGDTAEWENADGDNFTAQGGIFGMHLFVGLKLLLDFLDEGAAANLYDDVGVINTFLFVEYAISWVDGFGGDHMNVGDQTFMFGLMMEF